MITQTTAENDDRNVVVTIRQRGYLGNHEDRAVRLMLEAQAINAELGCGPVDVDEAYRQLQLHNTKAYSRSLYACLAHRSRLNPRRWLDQYRLRRVTRWLHEHPGGHRGV